MKTKLDRRDFMRNMALLGMGCGSGIIEGKLNLLGSALAANTSSMTDYRTLVCVFLYGGNDSFNMVIPNTTASYNEYAATRQGLAVPRNTLLDAGDNFAFNPNMPEIASLYNQGDMAILLNAGPLGQPLSRNDIHRDHDLAPKNLFSHNHQQETWQKAAGSRNSASIRAGWGGLIAEELAAANSGSGENIPPALSINGHNIWQIGETRKAQDVNLYSGIQLSAWQRYNAQFHGGIWNNMLTAAAQSDSILVQEISNRMRTVSERAAPLSEATDSTSDFDESLFNRNHPYYSPLTQQLLMAARLIHARETLGQRRQLIFVGLGGWDTHRIQADLHPQLLRTLSHSLGVFNQTMHTLGTHDSTTLFTISDFGRTLTINGDGTDHGWGGHHLVMGGSVRGGTYGHRPSLIIGGDDDYPDDSGRIIPTLSESQYAASLSKWMGLDEADVRTIFPDLVNFDSGNGWEAPVRFFS